MNRLDEAQVAIALKAFRDYLDAPADPISGKTPVASAVLDVNRRRLIAGELGRLVRESQAR